MTFSANGTPPVNSTVPSASECPASGSNIRTNRNPTLCLTQLRLIGNSAAPAQDTVPGEWLIEGMRNFDVLDEDVKHHPGCRRITWRQNCARLIPTPEAPNSASRCCAPQKHGKITTLRFEPEKVVAATVASCCGGLAIARRSSRPRKRLWDGSVERSVSQRWPACVPATSWRGDNLPAEMQHRANQCFSTCSPVGPQKGPNWVLSVRPTRRLRLSRPRD